MTKASHSPKRRSPTLAQVTREKTLALMMNPPRKAVPKMQGHREWTIPLAERKAR